MSQIHLGDAELQEFETLYQSLAQEHFGTTVVALPDLIPFTEQLFQEAEQGDVPHRGQMHHIAPVALDPTEDAAIRAAARRPSGPPRVLAIVALILGPLLLGWLLIGMLFPSAPAPTSAGKPPLPPGTPGTVVPTSVASGPGPTLTLPPPPTAAAGFVTVGGQQLPEIRPNTLDLAGRSFLVYVAPVQNGNWLVSHDPTVANWLPGATANWAFALFLDNSSGADLGAWLARLQPGTPVTLRVSSDSRPHQFRLQVRQEIQRTQTEFLDPHRPGLTIAIKWQPTGDTRLLLQGTEEVAAGVRASPVPPEGR